MREILEAEFIEQIRRKEQVEGGKNGEKSQNEGDNVGKDKILDQRFEDSPS